MSSAFQNDAFQGDAFQVGKAQAGAAVPQPSTFRRNLIVTGIAAAWSLAVVMPLFATVGYQTQVDAPPPKADKQQAIVRMWEPPTWDTQVTRKAPIPNAVVATTPFSRPAYQALTAWNTTTVHLPWRAIGFQNGDTNAPFPRTA